MHSAHLYHFHLTQCINETFSESQLPHKTVNFLTRHQELSALAPVVLAMEFPDKQRVASLEFSRTQEFKQGVVGLDPESSALFRSGVVGLNQELSA